jgi:hypothetical protein
MPMMWKKAGLRGGSSLGRFRNQVKIVPILVAAIQELTARVEALENGS